MLEATEQRVLGSLLEKQVTVPSTYPMSLNAIRSACNQATSREPVTDFDEATVQESLRGLRLRELVRVVHGDRVLKYHQLLGQRLELADDERALITVLLLRGPQSPGELKTRTDRLHAFADRTEVEECLARLASREVPLVVELPKAPGHHDARWVHLLGPVELPAAVAAAVAAPAVDREVVLAGGAAQRDVNVTAAYDAVATAYALEFGTELEGKPFDRWLLARVAQLAGIDPVADVGCGPGHVTRFLAEAGASVSGFDVSPGMVEEARLGSPDLGFEVADFRGLMRPRLAPAWGPGGWLALATHVGDAVHHVEEFLGEPVQLDFVLHDATAVREAVAAAGLEVVEWYIRGPIAGAEAQTDRIYILARKPD